jgi:hypothetical protein
VMMHQLVYMWTNQVVLNKRRRNKKVMVREHIKYHTHRCGGELVYFHDIPNKDNRMCPMYKCRRCGDLVHIIICPSYNEFFRR